MVDRIPPHDLEAEAAVLSAVMIDQASLDRAVSMLKPEQFYSEAHRRMFEAAVDLSSRGQPVDVVQVATWLRDHERLDQVGGISYLTEVINAAPAIANIEAYARTVAQKWQLRQLLVACQRIVAEGYIPVPDAPAFIDKAEQAIYDVARSNTIRPRLTTVLDAIRSEFAKWADYNNRILSGELQPGMVTGVPTGLHRLDDATTGLQDGDLTILAARPGIGKTSCAVEIARRVGDLVKPGDSGPDAFRPFGAALFSLEMPKAQIAQRVICSDAEVELRKARMGMFDRTDWSKLTSAVQRLRTTDQFFIDDTAALSLFQIRAMVRDVDAELRRKNRRLRLVVVDYLQLATGSASADTREQEVASISRGLKALAKEMMLPVLALSSINRAVESRADKRPMMSDLRESGSIESDADNIIFIYRDDYYDDQSKEPGIAELIIAKQRNGPTGTVKVGFDARRTRFYNLPEGEDDTDRRFS